MNANIDLSSHKKSLKYIIIALGLTFSLMIIQALGAYFSNSLALFADSSHMLVHNSSLLIALVTSVISFKLSKKNLHTASVVDLIGGFINCIVFLSIAFFIFTKGMERLTHAHHIEINPIIMASIAILGFFIHGISAYVLSKGKDFSLNVQALFLHTFIDCLSSIFTFFASLTIILTGEEKADALASITIASLITYAGLKLLIKCIKKAINLKKEAKKAQEITKHIKSKIAKIQDIHNVEVRINNKNTIYCAHIVMKKTCSKEYCDKEKCKQKVRDVLEKDFDISESVIMLECIVV